MPLLGDMAVGRLLHLQVGFVSCKTTMISYPFSFTDLATKNTPAKITATQLHDFLFVVRRSASAKSGNLLYFTFINKSRSPKFVNNTTRLGWTLLLAWLLAIQNASCPIRTYNYAPCLTIRTPEVVAVLSLIRLLLWITHLSRWIEMVSLLLWDHRHNWLLLQSAQKLNHLGKPAKIFDK